jgi:hypothetical protein
MNCGGCGFDNADNRCNADELCIEGNCQQFMAALGCDSCPCNNVCENVDLDGAGCCMIDGAALCVEDGTCP